MARAKPRSNIYAFFPFLACLIMGVGIWRSIVRIQEYRGPEPEIKRPPSTEVREHLPPPKPAPEEPALEEPGPGLEEEETAPGAPLEGEEEGAPPAGEEEEGGGIAPLEGGAEEEAPEPEPEEEER
ncbi:MAG: hypothetical protein ACODAJ_01825 [Planctomycetota bacterium]